MPLRPVAYAIQHNLPSTTNKEFVNASLEKFYLAVNVFPSFPVVSPTDLTQPESFHAFFATRLPFTKHFQILQVNATVEQVIIFKIILVFKFAETVC